MFWFASAEFESFVGFVDELVAPHDFLAVVQVRDFGWLPAVGSWGLVVDGLTEDT